MNILITLTVLAMANHLVIAERKEPAKDAHPKSSSKVPSKKPPAVPADHESTSTPGPVHNLWIYKPSSQIEQTPTDVKRQLSYALRGMPPPDDGSNCNHWYAEQGANDIGTVISRPHISRTRIAKALMSGFDPYFDKGYFEPFEKRPKPVTLITFRKNGLIPHHNIEVRPSKLSLDVAEMQSPYNEIGSFWQDEIGQS